MTVKLRVAQFDEVGAVLSLPPIVNAGASKAAATLVSIPYIAPNPAACLFSAVSCDIGGQHISGQVNTIYRTLYESRLEQGQLTQLIRSNICLC